ncbi:hypothetical protein RhiLY_04468 [Ceratobasidium sp. AG-Ba]|nr:hypothetical protein RhiLY_04468 [Ceratobasidium sp. AG-Ba]
MDPNSIEGRYATQLIAQLEGVLAKAVGQERQRWAEPFQELQQKILELRSENVRLNVQIQSHQLESTNRALWHKRKAESDVLDNRPAKFPRQQSAVSQGFAPPTPSSSRALSADLDDGVEGTHPQPHSDLAQSTGRVNDGDATRELVPRRRGRPGRPIAPLPRRARGSDASLPSEPENEKERVLYCLCGGHEYGLMIHCDNPKCELFHAGCVNLKEVPSEAEEWHCPACIGSLNGPSMVPSRQFTTAAVQTATGCTQVDSSCQTDSEPEARISSPSINPEKRMPSLAILSSEPLLLSPFAPQFGVTPTSLSTPVIEMPITPGRDVSTGFSCGKDAVLIQVPKKLIESSRPSLFRMLQPTARKPWTDDLDTS